MNNTNTPTATPEKTMVFKVHHDGGDCILFYLEDALEVIKTDAEENIEAFGESGEFRLETVMMTQEEIDALPEFDGFKNPDP